MSTFNVKVKWNKETYDLELDTSEPPNVFKAQIFALTGVCTERQKVMFKGTVIKDDEWLPPTLKAIKDGVVFLMMGSCGDLPEAPSSKVVFMEDMSENELATVMDLPAGIHNLGNTCYLSATIQCLYTVPELRDSIQKYNGSVSMGSNAFDRGNNVIIALRDIYNKMDQSGPVVPIVLLEMIHMMFPRFAEKAENGLYAQQDANECWTELVRVLQQKLKTDKPEQENFVTQYFGGQFQSTLTCIENDQEEATTSSENFLQLSCFISQDVKYLKSGLKLRLEEELTKNSPTLNRDAQYKKTSKISRLPAYLSINLIRFFYKEKSAINAKILKDVKFPLSIDLFELCTAELQAKLLPMRQKFKEAEDKKVEMMQKAPVSAGEKEPEQEYYDYSFENDLGSNNTAMYQLNAVLTHKGRSSSSGHYVAWIKKKGSWFKCDDDQVSPVTEEEVLKLSGGGDWHCAYVLLYGPQLVPKLV